MTDPTQRLARLEVYVDELRATLLAHRIIPPAYPTFEPCPVVEHLTEREVEVLAAIADGLSQKQVAARLYLSYDTVKTHTRSAYRKIGVQSRSQATRWWLTNGVAHTA